MKVSPTRALAQVRVPGALRLATSMVTIGAFGGVHPGRQALIGRTARLARARCLPAVVWTFNSPPKVLFGTAQGLTSIEEKVARLRFLGAGHIVVAQFDDAFRRRPAEAFLAELAQLNPALVWMGPNFRFGASQADTASILAEHFPTWLLEPVRRSMGEVVSSKRIRSLTGAGAFEAADALQSWPSSGHLLLHGRAGLRWASLRVPAGDAP